MAIVKAPLKSDARGKCTRWRVILYNPITHKQEWATVRGGKREAKAYEDELRRKVRAGTHVAKPKRKTFSELSDLFLQYTEARGKRPATLVQYRSLLRLYLVPAFGHREMERFARPTCLSFSRSSRPVASRGAFRLRSSLPARRSAILRSTSSSVPR